MAEDLQKPASSSFEALLQEIRGCRLCAAHLPMGPRPVLQAAADARLLIVGQAPGRRVHESGVPFDDPSGERLRDWLGVDRDTFYDPNRIAIVPMGFCYPGTGSGGDLPPRPECAPTWHPRVLPLLGAVRLTLVIGQYAQAAVLGDARGANLTATVQDWRTHLEHGRLPLPHPSPRNNRWLKRNVWFAEELLPALRERVADALA
ncbi:uracil-DNA glycosylase family protein [Oleiagrimonas sp. MCCC 1A03011]|uniref:uracil-DNA glycosylase family protein n=1 Tax=Oleiagrimonas sp. MCCC 1A03011 TaxID=1926883 RepID=UPI000DC4C046|nr:uracil-DNA glycosylase family protein [Oleiagrimonas sp. MCCC 1A03011]RAP59531.1 uracil-DNA glycosylase [Oleiagrimonas sp. MCCC 1A03011]